MHQVSPVQRRSATSKRQARSSIACLRQSAAYGVESKKLIALFRKIDRCPICRREKNRLQHIFGVGKSYRPEWFLCLINPTYRNISSHPDWRGFRFPLIGTKHFWRVLNRSGVISDKLISEINSVQKDSEAMKQWNPGIIQQIAKELERKNIYLTNLVKCCLPHSEYPSKERQAYHAEFLKEEIRIVRPKNILCFGGFPFEHITGQKIKLNEWYKDFQKGKIVSFPASSDMRTKAKVFPCYFPIGRGKPTRAIEIMRKLIRSNH